MRLRKVSSQFRFLRFCAGTAAAAMAASALAYTGSQGFREWVTSSAQESVNTLAVIYSAFPSSASDSTSTVDRKTANHRKEDVLSAEKMPVATTPVGGSAKKLAQEAELPSTTQESLSLPSKKVESGQTEAQKISSESYVNIVTVRSPQSKKIAKQMLKKRTQKRKSKAAPLSKNQSPEVKQELLPGEHEKLRGIHGLLRRQFYVASTGPVVQEKASQLVAQSRVKQPATIQKRKIRKAKAKPPVTTQTEQVPLVQKKELLPKTSPRTLTLVPPKKVAEGVKDSLSSAPQTPSVQDILQTPKKPLAIQTDLLQVSQAKNIKKGEEPTPSKESLAPKPKQAERILNAEEPQLLQSSPSLVRLEETPEARRLPPVTTQEPMLEPKVEYSPHQTLLPLPQPVPGLTLAQLNTQTSMTDYSFFSVARAKSPARKLKSQQKQEGHSSAARTEVQETQKRQDARAFTEEPVSTVSSLPPYIEAFDWDRELRGAKSTVLSEEGWNQESAFAWQVASAWEHLPTLYGKDRVNGTDGVPLISHNALWMLSKLKERDILPGTGLVFGRVPAGWEVELSGRSEGVFYLTLQNQKVNSPSSHQERIFVYLNVSPGAHLIHLFSKLQDARTAIFTPVLANTATYLDLRSPQKRTLKGRVFAADSPDLKPASGVEVKALGQPSRSKITRSTGAFQIEDFWIVGRYPAYLEANVQQGYLHRYAYPTHRLDSEIRLYVFSAPRVEQWIKQLEGGVSPESGLVVGAVGKHPSLLKMPLYPELSTLSSQASLEPENYTLSWNEELQVKAPLEIEAARFLTIQVSEGLSLQKLTDENGSAHWSQMIVASPGVINVIAP